MRRRRLADLEARIAVLEAATPVSYDMPGRYEFDMDPAGPLAELSLDLGFYVEPADEAARPAGVYL